MTATSPGDRKKCPQCPRTVPIQRLTGRLVWPVHRPSRGQRENCPQSGQPYQEG